MYLISGPLATTATLMLEPVYEYTPTMWGSLPAFRGYRGIALLDETNVTVVAWYESGSYDVVVYVNGSEAYSTSTTLPEAVSFGYGDIKFNLAPEVPEPPVLNPSVESKLEPEGYPVISFPNGTLVNLTAYGVNETVRAGDAVVVVYGTVSRLRVDIDVYVFGVPPASYGVDVTGLEVTAEYTDTLHVNMRYIAPEANGYPELIPEGTVIRIVIEPLNIIVVIPVKG